MDGSVEEKYPNITTAEQLYENEPSYANPADGDTYDFDRSNRRIIQRNMRGEFKGVIPIKQANDLHDFAISPDGNHFTLAGVVLSRQTSGKDDNADTMEWKTVVKLPLPGCPPAFTADSANLVCRCQRRFLYYSIKDDELSEIQAEGAEIQAAMEDTYDTTKHIAFLIQDFQVTADMRYLLYSNYHNVWVFELDKVTR
ncbi:MAG: hypothetical protein SFX18_02330 [Pirellulales bacterium]|nr:hypothetical protein [Pirellulales bacterium]